jgi:hypothetical protein
VVSISTGIPATGGNGGIRLFKLLGWYYISRISVCFVCFIVRKVSVRVTLVQECNGLGLLLVRGVYESGVCLGGRSNNWGNL